MGIENITSIMAKYISSMVEQAWVFPKSPWSMGMEESAYWQCPKGLEAIIWMTEKYVNLTQL